MDPATFIVTSAVAVAVYAAAFHGWIFVLRRKEREHLWLAVTASGVACVAAGNLGLYTSSTVAEGELWQRWMFATSTVILVAFLRFSFRFLGRAHPLLDRAGIAFAGLVVLLVSTGFVFDGTPVERQLGDRLFVESGLDAIGPAVLAGFLVFFASSLFLYGSRLRRGGAEVRTLFATLCLWFLTGISDAAVASGLYSFPYLLSVGYLAIVVGISSILVRRFVHSMDETERFATQLHELVEERTEELRRKDLQLAQGERLATIGTLAASVAHEINNPIAFVQSNLNRLGELWRGERGDPEVPEILEECREGTARVGAIVSDLLEVARRGEDRTDWVSLAEVVESVLPVVHPIARYRATLMTDLKPVPRLQGDARLLGQVVLNLVLNALQAIPEGSAADNEVRVSLELEGDGLRLDVTDSGPGIPEELRERLFDPFVTGRTGQAGLGLAVSHQIVARHAGRLEVQSGSGGTCVTVIFPGSVLERH